MTHQIAIEGNAVIGNLEIEIKETRERANWWEDACSKSVEREKNLTKRLNLSSQQMYIEKLIREHLDEADYDDDDENMREIRRTLWNESDTEKQIAAEGYDKSDREGIPF